MSAIKIVNSKKRKENYGKYFILFVSISYVLKYNIKYFLMVLVYLLNVYAGSP